MKRLTITGFFSPDFMDQGPRLTKELSLMLKNESIKMPFDQTDGLENMLTAYSKLFTGENIGKVLLQL
jgi:NADPH-dependent curcumin reductase CurA